MSDAAIAVQNGLTPGRAYYPRDIAPPVDVFENGDEILVIADVPGVPGDAIDVRVENDTLTLHGRRPAASLATAVAREYQEVGYVRAFRIPAGVDTANVTAEARHGTVVIRLPKAASAKPRKIPVR